jgi:hypothetical protein
MKIYQSKNKCALRFHPNGRHSYGAIAIAKKTAKTHTTCHIRICKTIPYKFHPHTITDARIDAY